MADGLAASGAGEGTKASIPEVGASDPPGSGWLVTGVGAGACAGWLVVGVGACVGWLVVGVGACVGWLVVGVGACVGWLVVGVGACVGWLVVGVGACVGWLVVGVGACVGWLVVGVGACVGWLVVGAGACAGWLVVGAGSGAASAAGVPGGSPVSPTAPVVSMTDPPSLPHAAPTARTRDARKTAAAAWVGPVVTGARTRGEPSPDHIPSTGSVPASTSRRWRPPPARPSPALSGTRVL